MSNTIIKAKSRKGIVSLFLIDVNGVKPERKFVLYPDKPTPIPYEYGESMYTSLTIQGMIKRGDVIILNGGEEIKEQVIEQGFVSAEVFNVIDREEIVKILKGTDITAVRKLFDKNEPEKAKLALEIARETVEEMKSIIIKEVEKLTSSSIQVIEE